jgi:hypothetical protein
MNGSTVLRIEVALNTWYQIHTNGGTTTFARVTQGEDSDGYACFWFMKMAVDSTSKEGSAEVFGHQDFTGDLTAFERLYAAIESGI